MSTSSENLIHFAIRCHRENIWVLQLHIADSEKHIIVYYALWGSNWTFHVECDVSSMNQKRVPYHTKLKSNFNRLLYIIFFITQDTYSPFRLCKRGGIESKALKNKFWKEVGKKFLEKIFWEKHFDKKSWKKILEQKFQEKIFFVKLKKKILKKKFEKKNLKKKF